MKKYFLIFFFIFLLNCSFNEKNTGRVGNTHSQNLIDSSKAYSFEEYVNLLLNTNRSKNSPDINNFPD